MIACVGKRGIGNRGPRNDVGPVWPPTGVCDRGVAGRGALGQASERGSLGEGNSFTVAGVAGWRKA